MEQTPNLILPYIMPSQAQKHVTHNEAVRMLDALVQISVLDRDLAVPPGEPADGDRYLIAADATGDWSDHDGDLAAWQDGAWALFAPRTGWLAWIVDEMQLVAFDGAEWAAITAGTLTAPAMLGINAPPDETNRLVVSSPASLFEGEEGSHRLTVSKQETADTASIVLQTDHEGRAEIGLAGDDDLVVKVSDDGASWIEALRVEASGRMLMPAIAVDSHPDQLAARRDIRERLVADRTYYVRIDGDDGNDGLVDSVGGAFASVQHALDVAYGSIDVGSNHVTIQLGDGTYDEHLALQGPHLGAGTITLAGNTSSPQDTVIAGLAGGHTVQVENGATLYLRDLELRAPSGQRTLAAFRGGTAIIGNGLRFGASTSAHITAQDAGIVYGTGPSYAVVGDSGRHVFALLGGVITLNGANITVTGRTFATAFANADRLGVIHLGASTFTGTATGPRYSVASNSVINTNGGGATFLPGNAAGSTATGGQYV